MDHSRLVFVDFPSIRNLYKNKTVDNSSVIRIRIVQVEGKHHIHHGLRIFFKFILCASHLNSLCSIFGVSRRGLVRHNPLVGLLMWKLKERLSLFGQVRDGRVGQVVVGWGQRVAVRRRCCRRCRCRRWPRGAEWRDAGTWRWHGPVDQGDIYRRIWRYWWCRSLTWKGFLKNQL